MIVEYCVGDIIDTAKFDDFDTFYDHISYKFEKLFDTKYKLVWPQNKREYWLKTEE